MPKTHYIWDMVNDSYLMEKDGNGDTIAEYTNEPGEFVKLISQRRNGQTYFHDYDAQGSTRTVTDENQDPVETATYSAFGETVAKTSSLTNPFGFKGALGYYTNPETHDLYVRARTLATQIGRWLSRNPLGFIDRINMCPYVIHRSIQVSGIGHTHTHSNNSAFAFTIGPLDPGDQQAPHIRLPFWCLNQRCILCAGIAECHLLATKDPFDVAKLILMLRMGVAVPLCCAEACSFVWNSGMSGKGDFDRCMNNKLKEFFPNISCTSWF